MAKNEVQEPETDEGGDAPLIDQHEAAIKKLKARAKKRGFVTVDEINEALPQEHMTSEQIEDVMSEISEMGVNIVENEEGADEEKAPNPEANRIESVRLDDRLERRVDSDGQADAAKAGQPPFTPDEEAEVLVGCVGEHVLAEWPESRLERFLGCDLPGE